MTCRLAVIGVPGPAEPWERLGFHVVDGRIAVVNGAIAFGTAGLVVQRGELDGELDGGGAALPGDVDGIPLSVGERVAATDHPNGAFELDHLVWFTSSLDRSSAAIEAALGLPCRRVRETPEVRQAFHRFDGVDGARGCILELAETDRVERSSLMGVVFDVADLHTLAGELGPDLVSPPRRAVQQGRWISSVRRDVGLGTAVALMTPG